MTIDQLVRDCYVNKIIDFLTVLVYLIVPVNRKSPSILVACRIVLFNKNKVFDDLLRCRHFCLENNFFVFPMPQNLLGIMMKILEINFVLTKMLFIELKYMYVHSDYTFIQTYLNIK